jgi:GNAT superfamily N-acetyltransferase
MDNVPARAGVTLELTSTATVHRWLWEYAKNKTPDLALLVILFGGERLSCCDEAVVATSQDGRIVGLATLAPEGETGRWPEIVGLYVDPAWRRQGIGKRLLTRAVERMAERGLVPVRIDLLSGAAAGVVEALPHAVRQYLVPHSRPQVLDLWEVMTGDATSR